MTEVRDYILVGRCPSSIASLTYLPASQGGKNEVLDAVTFVAPTNELGTAIAIRYAGRLGRIGFYTLDNELSGLEPEEWAHLIETTKR